MKKIILIFISLSATVIYAQNVDGGATKILTELASKYSTYTSAVIDYTYKCEKNSKVLDSEKGKLYVKGDKYAYTFANQEFFCDGVTVWNLLKESNEVSIFDYDETDEGVINPIKLLTNWNKDFRAKFIREELIKDQMIQIIDLIPLKGKVYYKIRLMINKEKTEEITIQIFDKDNAIYSYHIDKMVKNSSLPDSYFIFNTAKYPNVEVNDMR